MRKLINVEKIILLLSLMLFCQNNLFSFFQLPKTKRNTLFITDIKQRKAQLKTLELELKKFQTTLKQTEKEIRNKIEKLTKASEQAQETREKTPKSEKEKVDFWNKKITYLAEQKQNLLNSLDVSKEIEELKENRISLISEIIEFLAEKDLTPFKKAYTWLELQAAQEEVSQLSEKQQSLINKQRNLIKNKETEENTISSLNKQIDVKNAEQDRVLKELKEQTKKPPIDQEINLAEKISLTESIFNEEIITLNEKIKYTSLKIEKLNEEIEYKKDEIKHHKSQILQLKKNLGVIEKNIIVLQTDVDNAKAEANEEGQRALKTKNIIDKKIDAEKLNKAQLDLKVDKIDAKIKQLKRDDLEDTVEYYTKKAEYTKLSHQYHAIDQTISRLNIQRDLIDAEVKAKELWYERINLYYTLKEGEEDLNALLLKFKSKKEEEGLFLQKLQAKKSQATEISLELDKKITSIEKQKEDIRSKKENIFRHNEKEFYDVLNNLETGKKYLDEQRKSFSQENVNLSKLLEKQEKLLKQYDVILSTIETQKIEQNIWERSPKAISYEDFTKSLLEAEVFLKRVFWDTPEHLGPTVLIDAVKNSSFSNYLAILFFIIFFILAFIATRIVLQYLLKKAKLRLASDHKQIGYLSLNIFISLLEFSLEHIILLFTWSFLFVHILFDFNYVFYSIRFLGKPYYLALFHLTSVPIMVYLSRNLLLCLKELNKRLSFLFFAEKLQDRFLLLVTFFCYSTAVLIPLKLAFLEYFPIEPTIFPNVVRAAYSLIIVVILLLFFSKEDVLRLIPSRFEFLVWVKNKIDTHYYPVFFFLMSLFILSNPYIGYSNLAWFLAFAIPSTALIIYTLFLIHYYIRKYALFLFVKEEDEEIIDKFEYAKTYYGFFIIASFIALFVVIFILSARIWGYEYTPADIWKALSNQWVIPIGPDNKFGLVQLMSLVVFVTGGFLVSSIIQKFVFNKLFDILRTEPGTQNTFSKIFHYTIVSLATVFGFTFIHLENILWYVGTSLAVAAGLAFKDVVTDYIAGLFVLIERPLEIGNFVRIDNHPDMLGTVTKINARTTTLVNRLNHSIIIPNKDLGIKIITNWGKGRFAVGFEMKIRVDYNSDLDLVRKTIQEVVQANPTILRVPKIVIRLDEFEEYAVYFMARGFISSRRVLDQWDIASEIRMEMFKAFREKGINFAFPQHVLHPYARDTWGDKNSQSPISFTFDK